VANFGASQLNFGVLRTVVERDVSRWPTEVPVLIGLGVVSCATVRSVRVEPDISCAAGEAPGLTVYVADQTGAYLPGVSLKLLDPGGGATERRDTDGHGYATFTRLPSAGICALRGELPGFEATDVRPFPCQPQCHIAVSFRMHVDKRNAVTFT
jgi:hypothetical protein